MKLIKYLYFIIATVVAYSCSDDTPSNTEPETPENPIPGGPEEPDVPSDPNLLYNGIKLPEAWPPVRSYEKVTTCENFLVMLYFTGLIIPYTLRTILSFSVFLVLALVFFPVSVTLMLHERSTMS